MKKSLITLFALPAFALSLCTTACNKSAKNVTIYEATAITADGEWEMEGQRIKIENLCLSGRWGNHFIAGYGGKSSTGDKPHIEAELKSIPTFKEAGDGYGADVTLEGVLTDVDGRAVLKDATCKVNSERINKKSSDGHGLTIWGFYPLSRSQFDNQLDRTTAGDLIFDGTTFQIASMPENDPETWGQQQDIFYVVFPGENTNMDDMYNLSPIPVIIPEGINATTLGKVKAALNGKAKDDFVFFDTYMAYYSNELYGVCLLIEDFWGPSIAVPKEDPEVYTSGAALKAVYDAKFAQPIVEGIFNDEKAYSYVPQEYIKVSDNKYSDPSFIKIPAADQKNAHLLNFNANIALKDEQASDFTEYVNGVADWLDDAEHGWEKPENGVWTYKDDGTNVSREIVLMYSETNPTYLNILYFGLDVPAASPVIR